MEQRLHAFVEGTVQGVGFRQYIANRARFLGLTGWVRNTWNGEVEVVAEGAREDLEVLHNALKKGPISAAVQAVRVDWQAVTGEFDDFRIERTL